MSIAHSGISDAILIDTKPSDNLPAALARKINECFYQLGKSNVSSSERNIILLKLIEISTSYHPKNFTEYLWYVKFTCCILLLRKTEISLSSQQSHLLLHTFLTPTELWDACPIKIHLISKELFEILDDDYNLVYIIKNICNVNRLAYYVCVSLIWASFHRFANEETKMFRMHKIRDLIRLLGLIVTSEYRDRTQDIHRLLTLISAFQSLVILRKPRYEEYICFKGFFRVGNDDLELLISWLNKVKEEIEMFGSIKDQSEICMQIIEIVDLDILRFMPKDNGDSLYYGE